MVEKGKEVILVISLLLIVAFAFVIVINLGFSAFTGNQFFQLPNAFAVSDLGTKYTVTSGSPLSVNVDGVQRKLTLKNIKGQNYIGIDGMDVIIPVGKSNVFKLKDGKSLELKIESISKNNAVVVVKSKTKTAVVSKANILPIKTEPVKETKVAKPSFFSSVLNKLGIKKSIIPKQDILTPQIDVKQVKKPQVKKLTYPLYDFKVSGKKMSTSDAEKIAGILANRDLLGLLPVSQYGLLVLLELCHNGEQDVEVSESDVDCGGKCSACDVGKKCNSASDCISEACQYSADKGAKVCIDRPILCEDTSQGVILEGRDIVRNKCDGRTLVKYYCYGPHVKAYRETRQVCPEGTFCRNGEDCAPESVVEGTPGQQTVAVCRDTDIENNKMNMGIVFNQNNEEIGRDRCYTDREVEQVDCEGDNIVYRTPELCGDGEACSDGVCIPWEVCYEPNPGESRPGSTVFETRADSSIRRHIDECASSTRVRHIICDGYTPKVSETDCPVGLVCNNGLCGQQAHHCLEFDWGAVDSEDNSYGNRCSWQSPRIVEKAKCLDSDAVGYMSELCREGVCMAGVCVKPECSDTDGRDVNQKGHTYGLVIVPGSFLPLPFDNYDGCRDWVRPEDSPPLNDQVVEQLCDEYERPEGRYISCEGNQYCEDGACKDGEKTFICEDTDGGDNILKYGEISVERSGRRDSDWCINVKSVHEYYCREKGYVTGHTVQCPQFDQSNVAGSYPYCDKGQCIKALDTDPESLDTEDLTKRYGSVWNRGSIADIRGIQHFDFCRGGKDVELSADENGEIVEHEVECPSGYMCKESDPGVCSSV